MRGTTPERGGPGLEGHDYAEEGVRVLYLIGGSINIPSDEFSYLKVPPNVSLTRSSTIRPESLIFFAELQGLL